MLQLIAGAGLGYERDSPMTVLGGAIMLLMCSAGND
jgi:hypothetical protein